MSETGATVQENALASVKAAVQEKYGAIAASVRQGAAGCCGGGSSACCGTATDPITSDLYSAEETGTLPEQAVLASLGVVGQRRDGCRRVHRHTALIGLPEHQSVAHRRNVGGLLEKVEVPGAVRGVAVEDGADDPVVAQDDALVDAARRIAQHDLVVLVAFGEVAGREQVDAGDL